ncbi:MAG TPA: Smr/MutS family protein [Polyangiaceae bacterium]|nr:Smr/MutS family protein [Polyangiaceae bacterium]
MSQSDPPEDPQAVVVLPIEDSIDLHTFQPRDIPDVVESYLEAAHERGLREVRIIHGRGTGFQRARVRQVLERHPLVEHFADAPPSRGGFGAQLVQLKHG